MNLCEHRGVDLSSAYASAVAQFRALRAELHVARAIALNEAEYNGVEFGPSQVEINFTKEEKAYDSFRKAGEDTSAADAASKKWKAVVERVGPAPKWTKGQEYTRLWKKGVRPVYAPVLAEPEINPEGMDPKEAARIISSSADFLSAIPQAAS